MGVVHNKNLIFEKIFPIFKSDPRPVDGVLEKLKVGPIEFFFMKFLKMQLFLTQHSLLAMTEEIKKSRDKGNAFRALLCDLSKAFDYIDHILFIAKLFGFGVSHLSLKLI